MVGRSCWGLARDKVLAGIRACIRPAAHCVGAACNYAEKCIMHLLPPQSAFVHRRFLQVRATAEVQVPQRGAGAHGADVLQLGTVSQVPGDDAPLFGF